MRSRVSWRRAQRNIRTEAQRQALTQPCQLHTHAFQQRHQWRRLVTDEGKLNVLEEGMPADLLGAGKPLFLEKSNTKPGRGERKEYSSVFESATTSNSPSYKTDALVRGTPAHTTTTPAHDHHQRG
jgi:hypothetical protein